MRNREMQTNQMVGSEQIAEPETADGSCVPRLEARSLHSATAILLVNGIRAVLRQDPGRDALAWLAGNDPEWPFSFRSVCEVLGVDPDALRRALLACVADLRGGHEPGIRAVRQQPQDRAEP